jgi:hypothetical protein
MRQRKERSRQAVALRRELPKGEGLSGVES